MITLAALHRKALNLYERVLTAHLTGDVLFPLVLPAGKFLDRRAGPEGIYAQQKDLLEQSKNKTGIGYWLDLRYNARTGQSEIARISFETRADYLIFLEKEMEFDRFAGDVATIEANVPALLPLLEKRPRLVIEQAGKWPDLLAVAQYFLANPQPRHYVRALPINVPTKFIENNRPALRVLLDFLIPDHLNAQETDFHRRFHLEQEEPMVKIRFLDASLRLHPALSHLSVWLSEFRNLRLPGQRVFVIENLTSFLTFPDLPDSLALWGAGFAVTNLGNTDWLADKQLYYWGDIDVHGFQMLSLFREHYPHAQSWLMDEATFRHHHTDQTGDAFNPLPLANLTPAEEQLYNHLLQTNARVEQERLGVERVTKKINSTT